MHAASVFHEGERAVQARAGEAVIADHNGTVLSTQVIPGARAFISKQFMAAVASVDQQGRVWSSVLFGQPGFLHTADGTTILVDVARAERDASDPFWANIGTKAQVGMLFIEIGSRRRYRVNGALLAEHEGGIEIGIREAYPNCPKFIQRRKLVDMGQGVGVDAGALSGTSIDAALATLIAHADTLFVASVHAERGADASHRGGAPGFVTLLDAHTLRIPDYQGNSMFNTLGNFSVDPHAGICIPDFAGNRLLQLTGRVTLRWDEPDPRGLTGGTGRFWDVAVDSWHLRAIPQRLEWEYLDASPFNPPVGAQESLS
ncbi:pyridoxamine 5'-phosphate oxidase family protein [Massilia sp. CF038]|uniref:pyridoxamine 5'-phosphate oxidase family protein n=1 Tax=Massilia sp. CF038 TaxID=1881045 RepID=UPI00091841DC|nr:pyridoxamine 5'-phosphate oxidase family protein [Massilia sp. CF038]SHG65049.1 hypothetical protein SAMN05428948_1447 [Massilia sp. CF038]